MTLRKVLLTPVAMTKSRTGRCVGMPSSSSGVLLTLAAAVVISPVLCSASPVRLRMIAESSPAFAMVAGGNVVMVSILRVRNCIVAAS